MSKTIWKVALKVADEQRIMVPAGAEMLCAREQFDDICVWFRCDPDAPKKSRKIRIIGTGHPMREDDGRYLGTASVDAGRLMFHVFEAAGE